MRVRISYVVDVSDELRGAINDWYGQPGLADREAVKRWYEAYGDSMDMDLMQTVADHESDDIGIEGAHPLDHLPAKGTDKMAAGELSAPGTDWGPCVDEHCRHTDCAATRQMARTRCVHCDEIIGYERAFFHVEGDDEPAWSKLAHAICRVAAQRLQLTPRPTE